MRITLADGYSGHTARFQAEPLVIAGDSVLLRSKTEGGGMKVATKRYRVGLQVPTYAWANVEVNAANEEEAIQLVLVQAKAGDVKDFEYANWDMDEVTADFVEEIEREL